MSLRLRLEPRERVPAWLPWLTSSGAVFISLCLGGVILALSGGNPFLAYRHIFLAAFGSAGVWSDTLVKAAPLIMTGLACVLAFRMGLWNIGAEGQFYLGAFGATLVVQEILGPGTSGWIFIPMMMMAGMAGGAIWGAIPGILKAKYHVNEILSTLMLNYIAFYWNAYFIYGAWSERGFQLTPLFPAGAWLPRLADYADGVPAFAGMTIHLGLLFSLAATALVGYGLARTRWGYEIRLAGDNPRAAHYSGIPIQKRIVLVMMVSGALAGLAGMAEVSGVVHRLQDRISPGYGFNAVLIAWLAKLNPWAVVPVSVLFGGLLIGSREIQPPDWLGCCKGSFCSR
jgi:general nucleoside transport system permease protein